MTMLDVDGISLYYNVKGEGTPIVLFIPHYLQARISGTKLMNYLKSLKLLYLILEDMEGVRTQYNQ
jgi:hypothetical protein